LKKTQYLIIFITSVFLIITLAKSLSLTLNYGGGDLRTRIVGARLLSTAHSPYFYKWNPMDTEFYLDPGDQPGRVVNGNVVTPATLYVLYPLSQLNYYRIIVIWNFLQLIAGIFVVYLVIKNSSLAAYAVPLAIVINGLICSETWLYNIERCQMYIFYTFIFALMYRFYLSNHKYNEFLSGFIGGLFILFRPFTAIVGLGFLLYWRKKWLMGCASGFLIGCVLFVLPQPTLWSDYFSAMRVYISENTGQRTVNVKVTETIKPIIIEGSTKINEHKVFNLERLDTLYHLLNRFGYSITNTQSVAIYIILIISLSALFLHTRKETNPVNLLFLFGFLVYILAEQFVLAPRAAYNVIQWLFPLIIISMLAKNDQLITIGLTTGLLLLHHFPFAFPFQEQAAELIFFALLIYVTFFSRGIDQNIKIRLVKK
jgi:Glycosyltransferase family 87